MRKIFYVVLLAGVALSVASCCSCRKTKAPLVADSRWELIEINSSVIDRTADSNKYTLYLGPDKSYNGVGDCNRYFGTYEMDKNEYTIEFSMPASTRMMCPDQASETGFLQMLGNVKKYKLDGDVLTLIGANDESLASFRKKEK